MALDTLKFVDSIASSPTTRLDLNDGSLWYVREFYAPPPRLRRSLTTNAMTDGAYATSSTYDNRVITVVLDLVSTTEDINATELQKLARELDRSTNFLQYKPDGATSPVFFRTERADFSELVDFNAALAYRRFTIEVVAEPFALGLRETVSVGTVNNDPAAGSNGCYFDVSSVKGDVAAPIVFTDTVNDVTLGDSHIVLGVRQSGTPANMTRFIQAESLTPGTDTTNPGGAADAAMSGSGTTNYLRTTFATVASMDLRAYGALTSTGSALLELAGDYRCYLTVRRSSAVGTVQVRVDTQVTGETRDTLPSTSRQIIDMGILPFTSDRSTVYPNATVAVSAARVSGTSTLDIDCVQFVPAGAALFIATGVSFDAVDFVADGEQEALYTIDNAANLFTGAATAADGGIEWVGSVPRLMPGVTNRFVYLKGSYSSSTTSGMVKTSTGTVTIYYMPRYLFVRPATT